MTNYTQQVRKITWVLFSVQALTSAGFISVFTITAILGDSLSGNPSWAGVPAAVVQIAAALSAVYWGFTLDRMGRRGGLTLAMLLGIASAIFGILAVQWHSFLILLLTMVLIGFTQAATKLSRFVAAEVHPPGQQGRAIAFIVLAGTVGAVFGPLLIDPSSIFASTLALDKFAGPFLITAVVSAIAALILFIFLRPDPKQLGEQIAQEQLYDKTNGLPVRNLFQIIKQPQALLAVNSMILGQLVMVMIMVITSLHMKSHLHNLKNISIVFSMHTLGMFAFSIVSGRLTDKIGRIPVLLIGATTLMISGLIAPISTNLINLSSALFLLGLGWNFCFVAGSSLLSDQLNMEERSRAQGTNDLLVGLASGVGSFGSGLIYAAFGFNAVSYGGFGIALFLTIMTYRLHLTRKRIKLPV